MACPACNAIRGQVLHEWLAQVYRCRACECLHGTVYRGDLYGIVNTTRLAGPDEEGVPGSQRPFDFMVLGSDGVRRVHGWYNPTNRLMTQVG